MQRIAFEILRRFATWILTQLPTLPDTLETVNNWIDKFKTEYKRLKGQRDSDTIEKPKPKSETDNEPPSNVNSVDTNPTKPQITELNIFISHNNQEEEKAIAKEIIDFFNPYECNVFYENSIKPGEKKANIIEEELNKCNLFIALISPNNNSSTNNVEPQLRKVKLRQDNIKILPILIKCEKDELGYYLYSDLLNIKALKWNNPEDTDILKDCLSYLLEEYLQQDTNMGTVERTIEPINSEAKKSNTTTIDKQILDCMEEGKLCYLLSHPLSETESKILREIILFESDTTGRCILNADELLIEYQNGESSYNIQREWYQKIIDRISNDLNCQFSAEEYLKFIEIQAPEKLFSFFIENKVINNPKYEKFIIVFNGLQIQSQDYINNDMNHKMFKNKLCHEIVDFYRKRDKKNTYKKLNFILIDDIFDSEEKFDESMWENPSDKHLFFGWALNVTDGSLVPMMPKLTKNLKNIDKEAFMQCILKKTNGLRDLTQDIVREALLSTAMIDEGEEGKFVKEIIKKIIPSRN